MENNSEHKFLAQHAMWALHEFYSDDEWTFQKLSQLFTTYYPDAAEVENALNFVMEHISNNGSLNDKSFRAAIMKRTAVQLNRTLSTLDPLSRIAAMSPYPPVGSVGDDFDERSARFYTKVFQAGAGKLGYVSGFLGSGKTSSTCLLMELLLADGFRIQTNIVIDETDKPTGIKEIHTLKELLEGSIKNLQEGFLTINVLDEIPQFASNERATSNEFVSFKKLVYLLRKVGSSMVVISQRDKDVPHVIADMSEFHIQKKSKTTMVYRRFNEIHHIKNVPDTKIKFQTRDIASFIIDLDINGLHDYIAKNPNKAQFNLILEYLSQDNKKLSKSDLMSCAKVLYCKKVATQQQIAEVVGVSQPTVHEWLKNMGIIESKAVEA